MKIFRYIFLLALISMAVFVSADIYQSYIYDFEDFWNTSFYVQYGISSDKMVSDIFDSSSDFDVHVVYIDKIIHGNYLNTIDLYCDDDCRQILEDEYNIREGIYGSMFSGNTQIQFFRQDCLPEELLYLRPENYYIIGSEENAIAYKAPLTAIYGGSFPKITGGSSVLSSKITYIWVWITVAIIIWMLVYYRTVLLRKEMVLRLSFGEDLIYCYFKCFFPDCFVIVFSYFFSKIGLQYLFGVTFLSTLSFISVLFITIGVGLIYCSILFLGPKLAFSNSKLSYRLLIVSYVMKSILIICLLISSSSAIKIWSDYRSLKAQEFFYSSRDEYSYLHLFAEDENTIINLESEFYRKFYREFDIQFIGAYYQYGESTEGKLAIGANSNMYEYLANISELDNQIYELNNNACILIPDTVFVSDEEMIYLIGYAAGLANCDRDNVETIFYSKNINVVNYNSYSGYSITDRPIILYSARQESDPAEDETWTLPVVFQRCMMKIDMPRLETFCKENRCEYVVINVKDEFYQHFKVVKRGAYINLIILLLQIVFEVLFDIFLIHLEFETNRLEILIKKIHGYSNVEIIKIPLLITFISGLIIVVTMALAYLFQKKQDIIETILILCVILAIEVILILMTFSKEEKLNIQRIIKGGF